jgi:hypothetical protein
MSYRKGTTHTIIFQVVGDGNAAIRRTFHRQQITKLADLLGWDNLGSQVCKFIPDLLDCQVEAFTIVEFRLTIKELGV